MKKVLMVGVLMGVMSGTALANAGAGAGYNEYVVDTLVKEYGSVANAKEALTNNEVVDEHHKQLIRSIS